MMWRETGRDPSILGIDVRAILPFLVWAIWATTWMFAICVFIFLFFIVIKFFGYSIPVALRRLRVLLLFGKRRNAIPFWRRIEWR
jgi:intracellular multiplication protein IcmT